ncbi:structural protein [Acinetobacter phage vB_AbaM_KissB]
MDKIDYAALARSRYTSQFENDKVYDAIIQTIIEYKLKTQDLYINFAETLLDIDKSTGRNLDLIGSIVGQPRVLVDFSIDKYFGFLGNPRAEPYDKGLWYSTFSAKGADSRVLSDEEYKRIIKARIIRNKTNCSRGDFMKILELILNIDTTKQYTNILGNSNFTTPLVLGNSTATVTRGVTMSDTATAQITSTWVAPNLITNGTQEVTGGSASLPEYTLWRRSAELNTAYSKGAIDISFDIKVSIAGDVQVYSQNNTPDYNFNVMTNVDVANTYVRRTVRVTPTRNTSNNTGQSCLEFYGLASTGRIVTVKNVVIQLVSQLTTTMSMNTNGKSTKIVSGKAYTLSMKVATQTASNAISVTLKGPSTATQNIVTSSAVASRDINNPTLIRVTFNATISSDQADIAILSTGKLGDKFWVKELQITEGTLATSPTTWSASYYDSPRYTLSSPSHGNIDLSVFNYTGDLGIHFLSNFEKTGDLIPVPMGYKLSVYIN